MKKQSRVVSIVTPCFNEESNIQSCYQAVKDAFKRLPNTLKYSYEYEHIFLDNASEDSTKTVIQALRRLDSRVKYYRNNRNVGSIGNIWIGLTVSKGDLVVPLIPADLQDPPELIPIFIENWEAGYLVVQGIVMKRNESVFLRICRKAYYYFIATLAITYIPSGANEFCAIDRKVLNSVLATNDQKPYVRGLIHLTGSPTKYISYEKRKRLSGRSKENFRTYLDIAINAFISTSTLFPRLLILIGLFVSFLSFLVGFAAVFLTVINSGWGAILETGNLIWGLFFVSGLQIFFLGFVSEYIVSINQQVRPKPKSFFVESDD